MAFNREKEAIMSEITAITPQIHDKTRCNIEIDGRFFCGMKLVTVMQNRLKVGSIVTAEQLAAIQLESEKETALDKALTHISLGMKTEKEIADYLLKKGYLGDVIEYVLEKMRSYGFADDEAYARGYAEGAGKKKGKKLIALELRRKGISDEAIEAALGELSGEEEAARAVLEKYLRGKDVTDRATVQKAVRYLLSKGFEYDTVRSALAAYTDDED